VSRTIGLITKRNISERGKISTMFMLVMSNHVSFSGKTHSK